MDPVLNAMLILGWIIAFLSAMLIAARLRDNPQYATDRSLRKTFILAVVLAMLLLAGALAAVIGNLEFLRGLSFADIAG